MRTRSSPATASSTTSGEARRLATRWRLSTTRWRSCVACSATTASSPGRRATCFAWSARRSTRSASRTWCAAPAPRAAALRDALALWRGSALIDVGYEAFAAGEASRLEELRLVAREELNDAELELGSHDALIPELQALVEVNPLRERLWAQLMLALYLAGRQADASQAYQDARRTLLAELGMEPGPALKQLHGAIIRQEIDVPDARRARGSPAHELGDVATAILAGRVVPVLGEDAESAIVHLAERFKYPRGEPAELPRVSQYVAAMRGYGPLYDELRE